MNPVELDIVVSLAIVGGTFAICATLALIADRITSNPPHNDNLDDDHESH